MAHANFGKAPPVHPVREEVPMVDVQTTKGWVCAGDGRFYLGDRCGYGHTHWPAEQTTTVYLTEEVGP